MKTNVQLKGRQLLSNMLKAKNKKCSGKKYVAALILTVIFRVASSSFLISFLIYIPMGGTCWMYL